MVINPDQQTFRDYLRRKQHYEYMEREFLKLKDLPAVTTDGHRMFLKGNIEFMEEVPSLKGTAARGLACTEPRCFLQPKRLPAEDEQFAAYAAVVRAVAPYPVAIRTLDVGGDKFVHRP